MTSRKLNTRFFVVFSVFLSLTVFISQSSCKKNDAPNPTTNQESIEKDSAKYVVFGVTNKLFLINATNGSTKWIKQVGGSINSTPAYKKGIIYVGCNDNKVYAIDTLGNTIWTTNASAGFDMQYPILDNTSLFICDKTGNLYCLDYNTGSLKWKKNGSPAVYTAVFRTSPRSSSIALDENHIYLQATCTNGLDSIMKIDKTNGNTVKSLMTFNQGFFFPPIVKDNYLCYTSGPGVYCIDKNTFVRIWYNGPTGSFFPINSSQNGIGLFKRKDNFIYYYRVGINDCILYKLKLEDGAELYGKTFIGASNVEGIFNTFSALHYPVFTKDNSLMLPNYMKYSENNCYNETDFSGKIGNYSSVPGFGIPINNIYYNNNVYCGGRPASINFGNGSPNAPFWRTKIFANPVIISSSYNINQFREEIYSVPMTDPNLDISLAQKIIITEKDNMVRFSEKE